MGAFGGLPPGRAIGVAIGAVSIDLVLFTQLSDATDQSAWVSRAVPAALIIGAGLLAVGPLILRRRAAYAVCLIMAGHALAVTVLFGSRPLVSLLVVLYGAAVWLPRRRALTALLAVLAAHAMAVVYEASFAGVSGFAAAAVASVYLLADLGTWGAGRWGASARTRRTARRLEQERTALAAAAVDAERLRISHDLHDIVAHAVTLMLLQAGGARAAVRGLADPAAVEAALALEAVDTTGRQAVAELRRLLTVLRAEGLADDLVTADSVAGLAELSILVERVRAVGIEVERRTIGRPAPLDPSVDLTAYRVIQEALTNVNKYAGPGSRARVIMDWSTGSLLITVTDHGSPGPQGAPGSMGSGGFGLIGLAERVSLVGGRLEHGPRPDGPGYQVVARLPVADRAPSSPPPAGTAPLAGEPSAAAPSAGAPVRPSIDLLGV